MPDDQRLILSLLAGALLGAPAQAQHAVSADDSLRISASWDVGRHQPHDVVLAFALSRPLRPNEGRLAVIVGRADLSALLVMRGARVGLPLRGAPSRQ